MKITAIAFVVGLGMGIVIGLVANWVLSDDSELTYDSVARIIDTTYIPVHDTSRVIDTVFQRSRTEFLTKIVLCRARLPLFFNVLYNEYLLNPIGI